MSTYVEMDVKLAIQFAQETIMRNNKFNVYLTSNYLNYKKYFFYLNYKLFGVRSNSVLKYVKVFFSYV